MAWGGKKLSRIAKGNMKEGGRPACCSDNDGRKRKGDQQNS